MRICACAFAMLVATVAAAQDRVGRMGVDYGEFSVSQLTCVIGNNNAVRRHAGWYNGVYSMTTPERANSPFVPKYSGLNLENFFDARPPHADQAIFYEPRANPMTFTAVNGRVAELHQEATPYFGVESHIRFELKEPHYLDYTYTCVPRKPDLEGGFLGVFWASYIDGPAENGVHFLAAGSTLKDPKWETFGTEEGTIAGTLISETDDCTLAFAGDGYAVWKTISTQRYSVPFFYGRVRNMVLIFIFESDEIVRFAHSPYGGGWSRRYNQSSPGWDFQMIVPDYTVDRRYTLHARVVYKPWVGPRDVLAEVSAYLEAGSP